MQVVDLVLADQRSSEQCESYVRERALLRCATGPVFTPHHAIIRSWGAEGDAVALIIAAHAGKCAAPRNPSFEMVYVRWLQVRPGWLIVTAVLIQPRDGKRITSAVGINRILVL